VGVALGIICSDEGTEGCGIEDWLHMFYPSDFKLESVLFGRTFTKDIRSDFSGGK
jgi:hypothetical protein